MNNNKNNIVLISKKAGKNTAEINTKEGLMKTNTTTPVNAVTTPIIGDYVNAGKNPAEKNTKEATMSSNTTTTVNANANDLIDEVITAPISGAPVKADSYPAVLDPKEGSMFIKENLKEEIINLLKNVKGEFIYIPLETAFKAEIGFIKLNNGDKMDIPSEFKNIIDNEEAVLSLFDNNSKVVENILAKNAFRRRVTQIGMILTQNGLARLTYFKDIECRETAYLHADFMHNVFKEKFNFIKPNKGKEATMSSKIVFNRAFTGYGNLSFQKEMEAELASIIFDSLAIEFKREAVENRINLMPRIKDAVEKVDTLKAESRKYYLWDSFQKEDGFDSLPAHLVHSRIKGMEDYAKKHQPQTIITSKDWCDISEVNPGEYLKGAVEALNNDLELNDVNIAACLMSGRNVKKASTAHSILPAQGTNILKWVLNNNVDYQLLIDISNENFKDMRKKSKYVKWSTLYSGSINTEEGSFAFTVGINFKGMSSVMDVIKMNAYAGQSMPIDAETRELVTAMLKNRRIEDITVFENKTHVVLKPRVDETGKNVFYNGKAQYDKVTYFRPKRIINKNPNMDMIQRIMDAYAFHVEDAKLASNDDAFIKAPILMTLPEYIDGKTLYYPGHEHGYFTDYRNGKKSVVSKTTGFTNPVSGVPFAWQQKGETEIVSFDVAKLYGASEGEACFISNKNGLKLVAKETSVPKDLTAFIMNVGQSSNEVKRSFRSMPTVNEAINLMMGNMKLSNGAYRISTDVAISTGNVLDDMSSVYASKDEGINHLISLGASLAEAKASVVFHKGFNVWCGVYMITNNNKILNVRKNGKVSVDRQPAYGEFATILCFKSNKPVEGWSHLTKVGLGLTDYIKNLDFDGDSLTVMNPITDELGFFSPKKASSLNFDKVFADGAAYAELSEDEKVKEATRIIRTCWPAFSKHAGLNIVFETNSDGIVDYRTVVNFFSNGKFISMFTIILFNLEQHNGYAELATMVEVPVQSQKHELDLGVLLYTIEEYVNVMKSWTSTNETVFSYDSGAYVATDYRQYSKKVSRQAFESNSYRKGLGYWSLIKYTVEKAVENGEKKFNALVESVNNLLDPIKHGIVDSMEVSNIKSDWVERNCSEFYGNPKVITKKMRQNWFARRFADAVLKDDWNRIARFSAMSDTEIVTYVASLNGDVDFLNEAIVKKADKEWVSQYHTLEIGKAFTNLLINGGVGFELVEGNGDFSEYDFETRLAFAKELAKVVIDRKDASGIAGFVSPFAKAKAWLAANGIKVEGDDGLNKFGVTSDVDSEVEYDSLI